MENKFYLGISNVAFFSVLLVAHIAYDTEYIWNLFTVWLFTLGTLLSLKIWENALNDESLGNLKKYRLPNAIDFQKKSQDNHQDLVSVINSDWARKSGVDDGGEFRFNINELRTKHTEIGNAINELIATRSLLGALNAPTSDPERWYDSKMGANELSQRIKFMFGRAQIQNAHTRLINVFKERVDKVSSSYYGKDYGKRMIKDENDNFIEDPADDWHERDEKRSIKDVEHAIEWISFWRLDRYKHIYHNHKEFHNKWFKLNRKNHIW